MSTHVFVLDGRALSALAFTRRLDELGAVVHVGESFEPCLTAHSGSTAHTHTYPSPDERPKAFKKAVRSLAEAFDYDIVIPIRDSTTSLLAELQNELPDGTNTLLDRPETIEKLRDKRRCGKLARRAGVPIPETYYPSEQPIERIQVAAEFPVLLKPTLASGARGIRRVDTPEELPAAYRSVEGTEEFIVQEYVSHDGGHFSIGTVFDRASRPRAIHVYEELLQYPDSGGPAIRAVSTPLEPWVGEMLSILEAVDWTGPAHLDVLFDPTDGTYKLLEVNPRIWMSVGLTIAAGVDVPRTILEIVGDTDRDGSTGAGHSNAGGRPTGRRADGSGRSADAVDADYLDETAYDTELAYRWVLPNEILWALDGRNTPKRVRRLFRSDGQGTCFGILSRKDPGASVGAFLQSGRFLLDPSRRKQIFDRGWNDE